MTDFFIDEDFPCSQVEFDKRFSTEQACRDYLIDMKWPDGFNCPKCGHKEYWISAKGFIHMHSLRIAPFADSRYRDAWNQKTIDLLVQSYVVVYNPKIRG